MLYIDPLTKYSSLKSGELSFYSSWIYDGKRLFIFTKIAVR